MYKTSFIENNIGQEFISQFKPPSLEILQQREGINLIGQNEKIVQIPVRTKNCENHIQWSFDLPDVYYQSDVQELECRICSVKFTQSDIILDNYWYSFIKQFNAKCQFFVTLKDMCYLKVFRQIEYTRKLEQNQDLVYSLYERRDQKHYFSEIIKQDKFIDQQLSEFKYAAVCLQDHVKLYLPVRFRDCKHIRAYELSSLLQQFDKVIELENKSRKEQQEGKLNFNGQIQIKKFYQCRQHGCNVRINYDLDDLRQNLVLDYELLQNINLSHPSAINFQIKIHQGKIQFEDKFTSEKDQFIKYLWDQMPKQTQNLYPSPFIEKIKVQNCYKEFFSFILDNFQRIFINQDEAKVVKQILLPFRYQTYQISLFDPIANMIIEYPARCIECKDRSKCLDLRTLISILLNQKKQDPDKRGIQCPICSFNHQPGKPRYSIQINNTLYIDNQLLAQMIRDNSYQKLENNILQYNGKQLLLEDIKKHQIITIDQTEEFSKNNNGVVIYYSLLCVGTQDLLKDPLILITCRNQSRFNFDFIYDQFKRSGFKSNELKLCGCCQQDYQDIKNLYYDEFLANIILQLPQNYDTALPIKYDIQNKQFIEFKQIEFKQIEFKPLIAQNKGFFDMKDDLEYQELFKPRFHNNYFIQVIQRSTMIGGIKVTETADGRTIEGLEQKLETMNEIAQQEQFAKWGFKGHQKEVTYHIDFIIFQFQTEKHFYNLYIIKINILIYCDYIYFQIGVKPFLNEIQVFQIPDFLQLSYEQNQQNMLSSKTALLNNLIQSYTSQFKQPPGDICESRFSKTQDLLENENIVQIPVRTRDCNNHEKWSFDLFDIYQQSAIQYQQCGICNFKFTKDTLILDNYCQLTDKIRVTNSFGEFFSSQMIRDNSYQKLENNILQYNGKQLLLEDIKKHQIITIDQTKEFSKNNNGVVIYYSLLCVGTNDLLKDPLILITCPFKSIFNFDYIYDQFKRSGFKSNELRLCICESCHDNYYQDIKDLYYDEYLANIIPQLPQNYEFNKCPIKFKLFKDFKIDMLGLVIFTPAKKITQEIENQEKLLNRYNSISKKDQFKKWNLTISNIKFKANSEKFEI
ncbi:hypothetical protein pb186bvf_012385 [Paramecium bursaria]